MTVLGIETSCDETGLALYDRDRGLLAQRLFSQADLHAVYGGVVPELASRDHLKRLAPLTRALLAEAALTPAEVSAVAYTGGPGLLGALLVGAAFGRSLAYGWGVPALAVHHMEAHLLAPLLEDDAPEFPFLALLVSGGHSMLVDVAAVGRYRILGSTLDDAAGEAFDKGAKTLGLGYPGGPALARLAEAGDDQRFDFPRPLSGKPGYDFSFSGLKTALIVRVRDLGVDRVARDATLRADLAAGYQAAIVGSLVDRSLRAARDHKHSRLVIAGGVGANQLLRSELRNRFEADGGRVYYPRIAFCTDNGAMIALTGALRLADASEHPDIVARARWSLEELEPPPALS
ncbi:MAG: tRNA (adenosine(37)-N6)-threonylcarbamoyltransferase complex transferase subunit TsaD [Pseudomonadota bacterium]